MWMASRGAIPNLVSLSWFGRISFESVPWTGPIVTFSLFGSGLYFIIRRNLNYVIDSYQTYSVSSFEGVILVRNAVGTGFSLSAYQMYEKLGLG